MKNILFLLLFFATLSLTAAQLAYPIPLLRDTPQNAQEKAYLFLEITKRLQARAPIVIQGHGFNFNHQILNPPVFHNGDIAYLLGATDSWGQKEWNYFYSFSKWATSRYFRIIMNPMTTVDALAAVVQSPTTTLIVWSAHGSSNGVTYDINKNPVPSNIFSFSSPNLKMLILSNCYSDQTYSTYTIPQHLRVIRWSGTTDSNALINYLNSPRFDQLFLELLQKPQW